MKKFIILFILLNTFISTSYADIKVMAWNVEDMNLFDGDGVARQEKQIETSQRIASTIKKVNPDILLLTEAPSMVELQSFVKTNHLNYYVAHVRQKKGNINYADSMAMLVKPAFGIKKVQLLTPPLKGSSTPEGRIYQDWSNRGLMVAEFANFFFIGVHLKSPIGRNDAKIKKSLNKRYKQAEALVAFSKSIGIKPVIIAGDFNDGPGVGDLENKFNEPDTIGFLTDYFKPAPGNTPTHERGFRIDHIMVKGGNISDKTVVETSFKTSDHRPVWAEIDLPNE